jgi:hypothetical protein
MQKDNSSLKAISRWHDISKFRLYKLQYAGQKKNVIPSKMGISESNFRCLQNGKRENCPRLRLFCCVLTGCHVHSDPIHKSLV